MLLLALIIYVFGIVFTSSTGEHLASVEEEALTDSDRLLKKLFGSIPQAAFTLFKSVTNGTDWTTITDPLSDVHWLLVMLFVMYIAFTYFAVLNVVTGVFCQSAIESAQLDQDMVVQAQISQREQLISKLKKLFDDIDKQNLGTLTLSEFEERLQDDQVAAYFASLDLEVSDAWTLFKLLDHDETHVISIEDFVVGCLRLKGQAKSIDVAKMMYENKWMVKKLESFMRAFEDHKEGLARPCQTCSKAAVSMLPPRPPALPLPRDLRSKGVGQAPLRQVAWTSANSKDSWGDIADLPGQVGDTAPEWRSETPLS